MTINGKKTYLSGVLLIVFGVVFAPILAGTPTIGNVTAGIEKIIVGVAILLAINNASLRHALSKLEHKIDALQSGRRK